MSGSQSEMNIMMVTSSVCSSSNIGVHGSTRSGQVLS